jgi:hypothetical protein
MLVECPDCAAYVDGELISEYIDSDDPSGTVGMYSFLKCPRCRRPFILLQIDDGPGWEAPRRLYPPVELAVSRAIPDTLRSDYLEARACFRAKAYTATAIMCRKTLEGIAEENGITGRNLATALVQMKDKGIIENRLFEWADALRISGNEAAHGANSQISAQDASDVLEFTHALLEYVFTFQEKFLEFKNRQKRLEATT